MTAHSWNEDARHTNLQKLLTLADAFVPIKCSAVLNKLWVIDVLIDEMNGSLGAIVRDFDPEETSVRASWQCLQEIFLDRHVLCLRGWPISPEAFIMFAQYFGEPQVQLLSDYHLEGHPEISVISNYNKIGGEEPHVRATYWHTDDSYFARPAKATALCALALPSVGGDTAFIDCHAVLDAMPANLRHRIDGRNAVHKYLSRRGKALVAVRNDAELEKTPDVSHPLIRTHPETGRHALYINPNRIDHIAGMSLDESDAILDEIYAFTFQASFQYRHQWQAGDMLIWDNRCTMHRATTNFNISERREFLRILLKGDVPE